MSERYKHMEGLVLAHRDIRVCRPQATWKWVTAAGARAQQLALSIGNRYISRFLRPPRLNLLFFRARESAATPIHNVHTYLSLQHSHQATVNIAPRIALTVVNWPRQVTETSHAHPGWGVSPQAAPPIRLRSIQMIWRQASQMAASHTINARRRLARWQKQSRDAGQIAIVQRLLKRSSRVDSTENAATHPTGADVPARRPSLAHSIPQVVLRSRATISPADGESQRRPDQFAIPSHQANGHQVATAFADPPKVDINNLTEQVVRTIDRRIIAYRERMGRM